MSLLYSLDDRRGFGNAADEILARSIGRGEGMRIEDEDALGDIEGEEEADL